MDFTALKYDITTVPAKARVIDHFPDLLEYPGLSDPENDLIVRIVILATDSECPFVKLEKDNYGKRLQRVFEYLSIRDKTLFASISGGKCREYNTIVTTYFTMLDNLAYVVWHSKLTNFHYLTAFLREPIDVDNMEASIQKRLSVEKQLPEIHKGLVDYEREIFPDGHTRKVVRQQVAKILQLAEHFADEKGVI